MYSVSASRWRNFLDCLAPDLSLARSLAGIFIPPGAKVVEYAGRRIHTKSDIPPVPRSSRPQYLRVADPHSSTTTLQKHSKNCLTWLLATLSFSPSAPLADPPCLICMAVWFAETWHMQDLRAAWPFLSKGAQAYISSFEALAQLILLQAAYYRLHHKHTSFCLPSGSDNTAAEATLNTLFSTSWPLCHFLRLAAGWAHRRGVTIQVSHIADDLSRNRLSRFAHRPRNRFAVDLSAGKTRGFTPPTGSAVGGRAYSYDIACFVHTQAASSRTEEGDTSAGTTGMLRALKEGHLLWLQAKLAGSLADL